ncbi:MAG: CdaR family protein [Thermoanaerobaculia bacterium]
MNQRRVNVWGLRLFAIFAAVAVWFSASFVKRERVSEKLIDATVTYNPTRGIIILDPLQTVKVRLRGPDRQIRTLAPHVVDVVIEVTGSATGTVDVQLDESNVLRPEGLEVLAIEPNSIPLRLDREKSQMVKVSPRLIGEPAAGAEPLSPIASPDMVLVIGPESLLAGLTAATTSPINLDGHALTFKQTVSVVPPNPLVRIVQPSVVTVEVPMHFPGSGSAASEGEEHR